MARRTDDEETLLRLLTGLIRESSSRIERTISGASEVPSEGKDDQKPAGGNTAWTASCMNSTKTNEFTRLIAAS